MGTVHDFPWRFDGTVEVLGSTALVRLPESVSSQLPSRGQVAVFGVLDDSEFRSVLEPDGRRGHWLRLDELAGEVRAGDSVAVSLEVAADWPEPDVPSDLAGALAEAPDGVRALWRDTTPMARWEWVRWVNATANPATRQRRVEVSISKLNAGKRRPCCFDLSSCTDPSVSKSGKLLPTR